VRLLKTANWRALTQFHRRFTRMEELYKEFTMNGATTNIADDPFKIPDVPPSFTFVGAPRRSGNESAGPSRT